MEMFNPDDLDPGTEAMSGDIIDDTPLVGVVPGPTPTPSTVGVGVEGEIILVGQTPDFEALRESFNLGQSRALVGPSAAPVPAANENPLLTRMPPLVLRAYQDYLDLGAGRSTTVLWLKYRDMAALDAGALVPSTAQDEITRWEIIYRWRDLAIEHDNAQHEIWTANRKVIMTELLNRKEDFGSTMLAKAKAALDALSPELLRPSEIAMFAKQGQEMVEQATDKRLELENPKSKVGSARDNYAAMREMIANTMAVSGNVNIQINNNSPGGDE